MGVACECSQAKNKKKNENNTTFNHKKSGGIKIANNLEKKQKTKNENIRKNLLEKTKLKNEGLRKERKEKKIGITKKKFERRKEKRVEKERIEKERKGKERKDKKRILKIYENDDPKEVAENFCKTYSVKEDVKKKLIDNIIKFKKEYMKCNDKENEDEEEDENYEYNNNIMTQELYN